MSGFARVSDITRKLNQQNTAEAVLNITASEIGSQWQLGRCIAALRKPGVSTSTMKEFISSGSAAPSDVAQPIVRGLHEMAVARGALIYSDISAEADLETLRPQLSSLGVRSLLVIPLMDGSDHVGVLLLMQNTPRNWNANDVLVFKIIAEQVAIALNNVGLRRLVNNLSVTDENSGLLKRASYLDLLMGEIRRASQQNSPVSVLLMRFWDRAALTKEQGEAAVDSTMRRLGQLVAGNIRQNDLAFRYAANAIALVLAETAENEALLVVEKMRRLITAALGDKQMASSFNAGVAEAVIRKQFDAVDVVTEVINRVERALEKSVVDGPGKSVALPPAMAAAAVA
jgi:diguanylate cyclase (GGDEF)-like protein